MIALSSSLNCVCLHFFNEKVLFNFLVASFCSEQNRFDDDKNILKNHYNDHDECIDFVTLEIRSYFSKKIIDQVVELLFEANQTKYCNCCKQ